MHVGMPEEFQKPKEAGGSLAADSVVDDDAAVARYAFGSNQVLDDPEKGRKGFRACIDQTDPENVKTTRPRYVAVGKVFGRTQVEYDEVGFV